MFKSGTETVLVEGAVLRYSPDRRRCVSVCESWLACLRKAGHRPGKATDVDTRLNTNIPPEGSGNS